MDLIERQAAIDALAKQMPKLYTSDGSHPADEGILQVQEVYVDCIETLELLPSAQPERKMGHWIRVAGMNERCSACNKYFPLSYFTGRPFDINYCPNCGADMRGEKDEHID